MMLMTLSPTTTKTTISNIFVFQYKSGSVFIETTSSQIKPPNMTKSTIRLYSASLFCTKCYQICAKIMPSTIKEIKTSTIRKIKGASAKYSHFSLHDLSPVTSINVKIRAASKSTSSKMKRMVLFLQTKYCSFDFISIESIGNLP